MSNRKEDIKREFESRFKQLRKIINSYDIIAHAPSDEFDSLNYKILSNLYKGAEHEKIEKILDGELIKTYGLFPNEVVTEKLANEIMQWWISL